MEEQAVEIEEMYEKRMNNLQKSMKKQYSRKRRRRDDDGTYTCAVDLCTTIAVRMFDNCIHVCSSPCSGGECDSEKRLRELEERNIELEEELELERERGEQYIAVHIRVNVDWL